MRDTAKTAKVGPKRHPGDSWQDLIHGEEVAQKAEKEAEEAVRIARELGWKPKKAKSR